MVLRVAPSNLAFRYESREGYPVYPKQLCLNESFGPLSFNQILADFLERADFSISLSDFPASNRAKIRA